MQKRCDAAIPFDHMGTYYVGRTLRLNTKTWVKELTAEDLRTLPYPPKLTLAQSGLNLAPMYHLDELNFASADLTKPNITALKPSRP